MESFSLLKYWRGGGGAAGVAAADFAFNTTSSAGTATIVTAVAHNQTETDEEDDDDDGPFFDLEFAVPDEDEGRKQEENGAGRNCVDESEDENEEEEEEEEDGDSDGEREFNFTLSSGSSNDQADANLTFSPSDDLFFKGKLVPVEASSNGGSEPNSRPQLRVTLLKSAAKFRVFMSGLKKSKSNGEKKTETDGSVGEPTTKQETKEETSENPPEKNENPPEKNQQQQAKSKFFAVKFKVEEVPIMSLFTRDNSSRGSGTTNKSQKQSSDESAASEENRFSKDVMQKYLKMVKPLYIRVSRRYGEKFRLSGQLILGAGAKSGSPPSIAAPPTSPPVEKSVTETEAAQTQAPSTTIAKSRNMPAKLRVVCKHLGKSRSASSAVAAAPPGLAPSRRDDSLLQQQDGIQSAILHCKRSFNASRDSESSLLSRSVSDTLREKPSDLTEKAIG